jgi:hypothetical protein
VVGAGSHEFGPLLGQASRSILCKTQEEIAETENVASGTIGEMATEFLDFGNFADSFANARVESGGSLQGADDLVHDLFKITRDAGPDLYGDFFTYFQIKGTISISK